MGIFMIQTLYNVDGYDEDKIYSAICRSLRHSE